jgi:LAGLIDADG endonuclease
MEKLNFWFVTGLADAESSFIINIIKDDSRTTGYNIQISFEIGMKDKTLLENIKDTLGVGNVYFTNEIYKFKVSSIDEIVNVIIPHFNEYGLITQHNEKRRTFNHERFKKIVKLKAKSYVKFRVI